MSWVLLLNGLKGKMNEQVVAGIDIGGTKIAVALEYLDGARIAVRYLPTQSGVDPYVVMDTVFLTVDEMLEDCGGKLVSIGIGCPSPLDIEKGLVLSPSNMQNWVKFPIVYLFEQRFDVPVVLENDANAAALGEAVHGAGRGYKNIVYVTVSTGIGGGIIINGDIYHGVSHGAGELGHTIVQPDGIRCNCGSIGCVESICAGVHIARRARERMAAGEASLMNDLVSNLEEVSAKTVVDAVRSGDKLALEIWNETCRYLAIGIANSITLLAPEAVIIGGGISAAGDLLIEPIRRLLPDFVSMIPVDKINVLQAELGSESGVSGALEIAKRHVLNSAKTYAVK